MTQAAGHMSPKRRLVILGGFVAVIWVIHAFNWLTGYGLTPRFGLIPRSFAGLDGILFMPFLHGSWGHLISNSVPLLVMGGLLSLSATRAVAPVIGVIMAICGIGTWIIGSAGVHIGASGLIFGWFGFLLARGAVDRSLMTMLTAAFVGFVYGALIFGVLPTQPGVSWEAHLFGFLGGIAAAILVPATVHAPSLRS